MSLLERIHSPADVKALTRPELDELAAEMRRAIIETVARRAGHLAPNLGVVELTIALHRVFDSPRDRILWDVGHQSYPHKLLTGRYPRFDTLRSHAGLAGYPNRAESEHDPFEPATAAPRSRRRSASRWRATRRGRSTTSSP
jgi:1-deoxy-D-xylulose-5-phosphate synthase